MSKEIQDELNIQISETDLQNISLLNAEQQSAFNQILTALHESNSMSFFIDGPGGTGKTFLYRAILARIRSQGLIALATASSGVAASILPNGWTAHSRFKIPIDKEGKLTCNVSKQSGLAELLKRASLIIWDEALMANRQNVEAVDRLLRDITDKDQLFGGKVMVLGGDFRQVLPVISKGTKEECINASLVRSYIWPQLQKIQLQTNMRARKDQHFSEFLLRVRDGLEPRSIDGKIRLPEYMIMQPNPLMNPIVQLTEFIFPDLINSQSNISAISNSAILTPRNDMVDEINNTLIAQIPGETEIYKSIDTTIDQRQQGLYEDMLHSLTPIGMPRHLLALKRNCPIILLRNINPSKGLCNGTRLICRSLEPNIIIAEITMGERKGDIVFIPRISLQPNDAERYPVQFTRHQFPVRLCFAMTINKAQGQTLDTVGLFLPQPVFSHGQLYVALSRATAASKIKIYLEPIAGNPLSTFYTDNIVYSEVLQEAHQSTNLDTGVYSLPL